MRVPSPLPGLSTLERLYEAARGDTASFPDRALRVLDITLNESGLRSIPPSGPLLIVANHPHGAVDGLALLALVARVRPDVRAVANRMLARIPEMREWCFFVDPFDGPDASHRSRAGLRAAHLWLRRGGALVMFPSGEVAHRRSGGSTRDDSPWRSTAGRLAAQTNATVVPASIDGANSPLFYTAGAIHPLLRTVLLPRELLRKRGTAVRVAFHRPLNRVQALAPIVPEQPAHRIEQEVLGLAPSNRLVESGAFHVFCAEASAIPSVLREIGRLRELTYRGVGEGTGRSIDLDAFDEHYLHLFAWDTRERRIAGAYRLGRTDRVVAERGIAGLYTSTLFHFDQRLFRNQPAALELGRSFVRQEYQRHSTALYALWKGIGRFVERHPEYRRLFGCVSISSRYSDTSQALLQSFLERHHRDAGLASLVTPTQAPRVVQRPGRGTGVPASMSDVDALIRASEADGKGVPVLLRQYVKLNARLLGFNVDPSFGDALDALMMVDLADVDPAVLRPYFGRCVAQRFRAA